MEIKHQPMLRIPLFIVIFLLTSSRCSGPENNTGHIPKEKEVWKYYYTKDSIPELLYAVLRQMHHGKFEIADPDKDYNATDVIIDSLPMQKLLLLAQKGEQWRMTYAEGGFGKKYIYTECKIRSDSIFDFGITQTLLRIDNNDSIDNYLSQGLLIPKKVTVTLNH